MKKSNRTFIVKENRYETLISIKKPTMRYADEFLKCKCSPDLMKLGVFPDFKEVTESFGAYNAARKYVFKTHKSDGDIRACGFDPSDRDVLALIIGDGNTPRTAATFAFRTKWEAWAIDPRLKEQWRTCGPCIPPIDRYYGYVTSGEEIIVQGRAKILIVHVHSHADLSATFINIYNQNVNAEIITISIPCCVNHDTLGGRLPDIEYDDWGIWSPDRTVKIWYGI